MCERGFLKTGQGSMQNRMPCKWTEDENFVLERYRQEASAPTNSIVSLGITVLGQLLAFDTLVLFATEDFNQKNEVSLRIAARNRA